MADELARWAAERAPELLARAEAEAVAVLRDALVAAALPRARCLPLPRRAARRGPPRRPAMRCGSTACSGPATRPRRTRRGSAGGAVELVESGELAAVVSRVPLAEFGEEPLRRHLNELAWLERVARAHEAVLERALAEATIAPLRLCTIYEGADARARDARRRRATASSRRSTCSTAGRSGGSSCCSTRRSWPRRRASVSRTPRARRRRSPKRGEGAGYMLRRRLERQVARRRGRARRRDRATRSTPGCRTGRSTRSRDPPQNRDLSGHEGDMALNAAYLVEAEPRRRAARARRRSRGALPARWGRGSS